MNLQFGDIQETALIPLGIKASETARPNARIKDEKAKEIIDTLGVDVSKYDPFLSHEGVVARTILYRKQLKELLKKLCMRCHESQPGRVRHGRLAGDLPPALGLRNCIPPIKIYCRAG